MGMKLEAVDRKHSSLVCVASIACLMDSRILVHFDSWDEVYDYWADASSPYIHPVGWCHHNGHSLTPPNSTYHMYILYRCIRVLFSSLSLTKRKSNRASDILQIIKIRSPLHGTLI